MSAVATDNDQLYDLRGLMERGIGGALAADITLYTRENSIVFQKDRARFEMVLKVGAPLGHRHIFEDGTFRYDMFNFTLALDVISTPNPDPAANNLHAQIVSRVDTFMNGLQLANQDDLTNFALVTVLFLRGAGIDPSLKPENGVERSTLNYAGHFGIRPTAWPVP